MLSACCGFRLRNPRMLLILVNNLFTETNYLQESTACEESLGETHSMRTACENSLGKTIEDRILSLSPKEFWHALRIWCHALVLL